MNMADSIPCIDVGGFDSDHAHRRASLARLVDDTFTHVGFMTIVGHGVPERAVLEAERAAREFFALPLAAKRRWMKPDQILNRGYIPVGGESVGRSYGAATDAPPDLKEAFAVGPLDAAGGDRAQPAANLWPERMPEFRGALERYYRELEALAFRLLDVFSLALRLEPGYFRPSFARHNAILRAQFYPAQELPPLPGQLRIAAHTDYGAFTILRGDSKAPGLQVMTKGGRWIDIATPDECFVINISNLMKTWTNDRWQSNLHRVVNPERESPQNVARLSFPFFVNPSFDALIECLPTCVDPGATPRYAAVTAGEHRQRLLDRTA